MTLYKLTDQFGRTWRLTQWGEGVEHRASGKGNLCGPGWLHAYTSPLLAVLLNPIHADIVNPLLWEADGDIGKTDRGLKVGCTRLRTLRTIPLPHVTTEQHVRLAILCTMRVCGDAAWRAWATGWLDGTDRSEEAAARVARATTSALRATKEAVWGAAAWAANSAAAAHAAHAAAEAAAEAAAWAAEAWAVTAGAAKVTDLDLIAIAEEACR